MENQKPEYQDPVYNVKAIPLEKLQANEYNPNKVAKTEFHLLRLSILEDGYTQPIVAYYLEEKDKYEIVDGYHRYLVMKETDSIRNRNDGKIPVVVINKPLQERIGSTIRHNTARGTNNILAMSKIVKQLKEIGWSNNQIKQKLGMDNDTILRFMQIGGLTATYVKEQYSEINNEEL